MKLVRMRFLVVAGLVAFVALLPAAPSFANCAGQLAAVSNGAITGISNMSGCGDNAIGQFWLHRQAKWNTVSGVTTNASGVDYGAAFNGAVPDGVTAGSYLFQGDWGAPGIDGCSLSTGLESTCSGGTNPGAVCTGNAAACLGGGVCTGATGACGSLPDPAATDVVIAGRNPGDPTLSVALFGSVDFNPLGQSWILDNMGATGATCDSANTGPVFQCQSVVPPSISSVAPGASGHLIYQINFPEQPTTDMYPDDCLIAESAANNCPRNLDAGRALMVRLGPCVGGTPINNLAVLYTELGTLSTRTELWHPYNAGDADYNGFLDATPTVPNPITLISSAAQTLPIDITMLTSATGNNNCIYFATAAAADSLPVPGSTPWLAPYVSMARSGAVQAQQFVCPCDVSNTTCTSAGPACGGCGTCVANSGATAAPDRVLDLQASKLGSGKYNASWATSGEESIASFQLVGNKGGGTVMIKSSIAPKGGGLGASYSVDLAASDLKGSKQISVVVTYNDGSKASFGPVSVQ